MELLPFYSNDGETVTFDLALGIIQQVTLGGDRGLGIINVSVGQCFVMIVITGRRTGDETVLV
jgi:hypothetical protein